MSTEFVHQFVPGKPGKPTLLLLPGIGGLETDLMPVGAKICPGAALLGVRGNVLKRDGTGFFLCSEDGTPEPAELSTRALGLATFVAHACRTYELDAENMLALGYAHGADTAAYLLLQKPQTLRAAILLRVSTLAEIMGSHSLEHRAVLLVAGDRDPLVPLSSTEELARMLRERGAEATVLVLSADHRLGGEDINVAHRWLTDFIP